MTGTRSGPLAGVKVLSLAEQYPGPLCAQLLADLGASVVQLERPGSGDPVRDANPWLFRATNTDRRSVVLDLKQPRGLAAALRLVRTSDVFIEGYRPGVVARLGLGYDAVRAARPSIVYCSISGYGQDGPYADVIGHNINFEGIAGVLDSYVGGRDPEDYFVSPSPFGDVMAGSLAALGVVAALRDAERTGHGSYIDISITEALLVALIPDVTRSMNAGHGWHRYEAGSGIFATLDGAITLGISHEQGFWISVCEVLGLPADVSALTGPERVVRRAELRAQLEDRFRTGTTGEWLRRFGTRVPAAAVHRLADVVDDEHLNHRGMFADAQDELGRPFRTVVTPFARADERGPRRVEPLGASTVEALREAGVAEDDITALSAGARDVAAR